jgi:hypothetical protein
MKLKLSNGLDYGEGPDGKRVCRGALMGRPNRLPQDVNAPIKLRMERLKWVDQDYDAGGAYFGGGNGDFIYCAWGTPLNEITGNPFPPVQIFVRAKTRAEAKGKVKEILPLVRFFR